MPAPLEDRCECTHVKDKHQIAVQAGKIWSGPCRLCGCLRFVKSSIEEVPLTAADYVAHFPVELLEVDVEPAPVEMKAWPEEAAYWTDDADGDPVIPTASEVQPSAEMAPRASGGIVRPTVPPLLAEDDSGCAVVVPLQGISANRAIATTLQSMVRKGLVQLPPSAPQPEPTLLDFYDAWRCPVCSSRWFNKRRCCGTSPQPIRVEIHAREP